MGIVRIDQPDVTLVPDAMCAADDIIDNVGVDLVEAIERLAAGPVYGSKLGIVPAFDLQNLFRRILTLVLRHGLYCLGSVVAHAMSFHWIL
ncbi:hypothetical protein [Sinorhizobium medicae]